MKALATLESAADLPAAARAIYRLRQPDDPARRAAWNDRLKARGDGDQDLDAMADAFGRLAAEGPDDPAAWYNRALCLAWRGANREAVACLDRARSTWRRGRRSIARSRPGPWPKSSDRVGAPRPWPTTCDSRSRSTWDPADTPDLLVEFPDLRRVSLPHVPGIEPGPDPDIEVFEWLDRPLPDSAEAGRIARAGDLPVTLASVYLNRKSRTLRLSSPRVETLQQVEEVLLPRLEAGQRTIRREAAPLPLPFLDADVWTVRIPPGLEPGRVDELTREWVEHFYEDEWIHRTRQSLGGLSPLGAALRSRRDDPVLRARLTAVVDFREQLGARPRPAALSGLSLRPAAVGWGSIRRIPPPPTRRT